MVRMDRLLEAWRADPRVDATVELCAMLIRAALKAAPAKLLPDEFVIGFVSEARTKHEKNIDVLIAVSDLYLATGLPDHALAILEVASQFAGNDGRVKERLDKIGRRRRTAEFSTRTPDPETLDAPTTPLDPPTEPAGRGPPPPLSVPLNPRRKPTTVGLPLAPPPLPVPDRKRTGAETTRGSVPDSTLKGMRDDETTRTEAVGELPKPRPRQRLKTVIGTGDELLGAAVPTLDKSPPAPPAASDDDDGPPTRVDAADMSPITRAEAPKPPEPLRRNPTLDFGATQKSATPAAPAVDAKPKPAARQAPVLAATLKGEAPGPDLLDDGWTDPPTRVGGDEPAQQETPTRSATAPEDVAAAGRPSVVDLLESRMAAKRAAARKPKPPPPVLGPALEDGPQQDGPTRVVGGADPNTSINTSVNTSINTSIKRPDDESEGDVPTHARPVLAKPIPTGEHRRPPAAMIATPPPGMLGPPPAAGTSSPDDDDDDDDSNVTGIQELPPKIPLRPIGTGKEPGLPLPPLPPMPPAISAPVIARPAGFDVPRIPPPPPSDPETETATAVRPPTAPPPRFAPPPPPIEDALSIEPEPEEDDSMVTGLREPPPLPPRPMAARPTAAQPIVAPVVKGGTLAMTHSQPLPAFPSEPPQDDDEVPRTHVLNAAEALAAARADPRPNFARSLQPSFSSAPPPGTPSPAVQRGQQLGGAWGGGDGFDGVPVVGPAPSAPPVFGPPPSVPRFGLETPIGGFAPPPSVPVPSFGLPPEPEPRRMLPEEVPDPLAMAPLPGDPRYDAPIPSPRVPPTPPVPMQPTAQDFAAYGEAPEPRGRPYKLYAALVVAIVAVASLVGYATYLLLTTRRAEQAAQRAGVPVEIDAAIRRATPADLVKVDGELRKLEAEGSPAAKRARLQYRVLFAFEVSGAADGIAEAKSAARGAGVSEAECAFADLASAALANKPAPDALLATEGRTEDPFFQLALGIYRERRGDPTARAAFEASHAAAPDLSPATIRLARWLALDGKLDEASTVAGQLDSESNERKALEALIAAVRKAQGEAVTLPELSMTSADLPRSLHPVFSALSTQRAGEERPKKGNESDPQLKQAIVDAESPAIALFFGDIAFRRRDEVSVASAAERALALHKEDARALGLIERSALRAGSFERLEKLLGTVSPAAARPILATLAYERGDVDALSKIARELGAGEDAEGLVKTRLSLLRGDAVVPVATLEALRQADKVAGDLVAVDGLLLLGETAKARAIVEGWSDADTHPARALRKARVLRAEGKAREAGKALEVAIDLPPVLVERILVEVELPSEREHALSLVDARLGKLRPFLEAYVLARMDDSGKASRRLDGVSVPGFDAPLALRVAAALAYGELSDSEHGESLVRVLHERFPGQIDVKRAARKLGVTK